jgi:hypothetical protein
LFRFFWFLGFIRLVVPRFFYFFESAGGMNVGHVCSEEGRINHVDILFLLYFLLIFLFLFMLYILAIKVLELLVRLESVRKVSFGVFGDSID